MRPFLRAALEATVVLAVIYAFVATLALLAV